jgi:hypothetical protein
MGQDRMDQSTDRCDQEHDKVIACVQKILAVAFANIAQMRGKIIR